MPVKCLKIQYYVKVKLNKLRTVQYVNELFFEKIFFLIIPVLNVREEMDPESLNLIPDGVIFLKVIFQNFVLGALNSQFISGNGNFVDFKVLFFPD